MTLNYYLKAMLLVALPVSVAGYTFAILSIHVGGILYFLGRMIVPGLFLSDYIPLDQDFLFWSILIFIQLIYATLIIFLFQKFRSRSNRG